MKRSRAFKSWSSVFKNVFKLHDIEYLIFQACYSECCIVKKNLVSYISNWLETSNEIKWFWYRFVIYHDLRCKVYYIPWVSHTIFTVYCPRQCLFLVPNWMTWTKLKSDTNHQFFVIIFRHLVWGHILEITFLCWVFIIDIKDLAQQTRVVRCCAIK